MNSDWKEIWEDAKSNHSSLPSSSLDLLFERCEGVLREIPAVRRIIFFSTLPGFEYLVFGITFPDREGSMSLMVAPEDSVEKNWIKVRKGRRKELYSNGNFDISELETLIKENVLSNKVSVK